MDILKAGNAMFSADKKSSKKQVYHIWLRIYMVKWTIKNAEFDISILKWVNDLNVDGISTKVIVKLIG